MASVAGEVLKEGFLVKKGHVRHNWRTRWFVLLKSELLYFRTRRDKSPAGVIPLNGADLVCPPSETSRKPWLLHLTTRDNKLYQIQAEDQHCRDDWRRAIEDSIRKLDPAKLDREISPTRTLVRTETFVSTNNSLREIVQAMQDRHAGVPLREFRLKGAGPRTKQYFTGKDVIEWLMSWSFAEDRRSAVSLGSEMLQYGFFNLLRLDEKEGMCRKVRDTLLVREMVDSDESTYDFVVFAPGETVDLFSVRLNEEESEEDGEEDSDSDSEEEIPARRTGASNASGQGEVSEKKVLKQGFLLKKGKRRHNWKARKFVLRENDSVITYSKGSKNNRILGEIPLKDLTVIEKDVDKSETFSGPSRNGASVKSCVVSTTDSLPYHGTGSVTIKKRRLVLLTATGVRYELEANTVDERESWVQHIRAAIESC